MQKSIVTKYFCICSAVILACVICVGSVLLLVASQFYKMEKKEALIAGVNEVITATRLCYLEEQTFESGRYTSICKSYSVSTGTDYIITDNEGIIIADSFKKTDENKNQIGKNSLELISDGYFEIGNFGGYFDRSYFVVSMPVDIGGNDCYVVSYMSVESLQNFVGNLVKTFLIVSIVTLSFILIILYCGICRLLEPIQEMTNAAKRFGKGDFSQKIEVAEDNEIGILAGTMNDMAYSLSMLENSRKSFIANVSHELKTPMTTIGGFVDGILDGTIPKEQQKHYLKIVSEEVSRLSRLVRSMLNIAKYETGEMELKMAPFDITSLTIKTVLLFENHIEDKHIDIKGLDAKPYYVLADIDLVQQIIYNLVENAVKFVNEYGYISFKFALKDKNVTVSIRNSGEGLTREELPKVFDKFYKTDESHGKDTTGVGLGLSIVRSIINLHEGNILVRSTKGEYTEFSFTLSAGETDKIQMG